MEYRNNTMNSTIRDISKLPELGDKIREAIRQNIDTQELIEEFSHLAWLLVSLKASGGYLEKQENYVVVKAIAAVERGKEFVVLYSELTEDLGKLLQTVHSNIKFHRDNP